MHYLEATFRTAIRNKGFKEPFVWDKTLTEIVFKVCRDGYNLAKDLHNLGLTGIIRKKDDGFFLVTITFCNGPAV